VLFSLDDPEPLIEAASSEEKKSDDEEKEEAALEEEDEEKKSKKKDKKKGSGHPADELLDDISAMDIAPDGSIILLSQVIRVDHWHGSLHYYNKILGSLWRYLDKCAHKAGKTLKAAARARDEKISPNKIGSYA
jgi:hypothetical protein